MCFTINSKKTEGITMKELIKKNRNLFLILIDVLVIIICYSISIFFLNINITNFTILLKEMMIAILVYEIFLNIFQMYRNLTQYEVGKDYIKYILSAFLAMMVISCFDYVFQFHYLAFRLNVLAGVLTAGAFVMYRLAGRSILIRKTGFFTKKSQNENGKQMSNLLIIGAGMGAREIIIAIQNSMMDRYNIVGIIDDDISKINRYILGVKVLGKSYDIPKIVKENEVDVIFFAINKIDAVSRRKILEICKETGIKTRVLPTTEDVINKQGAINSLRDVEIEDLLGREAVHLDNKNIQNLIKGKTVLVTGGRRFYWFRTL